MRVGAAQVASAGALIKNRCQKSCAISEAKRDSGARNSGQTLLFGWKLQRLVTESSPSMPRAAPLSSAEKARRYRQRRRDAGIEEVLFQGL